MRNYVWQFKAENDNISVDNPGEETSNEPAVNNDDESNKNVSVEAVHTAIPDDSSDHTEEENSKEPAVNDNDNSDKNESAEAVHTAFQDDSNGSILNIDIRT